MADMPYQSFSDFIAKNRTAPVAAPRAKPISLSGMKVAQGSQGDGSPQDALSWLVDIISRPLYAVTETADSLLEIPDASDSIGAKFNSGDTGGAIGEILGTIGKNVSAPVRGFFSTNRDDKRLTSDLIEKGTDVIGSRVDPTGYVDTEDNVNPVLKGVLGFLGDVAGDPLTWIPGTQLVKGVNILARGAKAVGEAGAAGARAASKSLRGVEAGTEAAKAPLNEFDQFLAESTRKTPPVEIPKPFKVVGHNGGSSFIEEFRTMDEAKAFGNMLKKEHGWTVTKSDKPRNRGAFQIKDESGKVADTPFVGPLDELNSRAAAGEELSSAFKLPKTVPAQPIDDVVENIDIPVSLGEMVRNSPRTPGARGFLQGLIKPAAKTPKAVPAVAAPVEKLSEMDWIQSYVKNAPEKATIPTFDAVTGKPNGLRFPVSDIVKDPSLLGAPGVRKYLNQGYAQYLRGQIDEVGRPVKQGVKPKAPKKAKPVATEEVTTAMARFHELYSSERGQEQIEGALGTALMDQLRRIENPDNFDKVIQGLNNVLNDTGLLDDLKFGKQGLRAATGRLLKQLGIADPEGAQRAYRDYVENVHRPTVQGDILEQIERVSADLDPALQDLKAVLPGWLEKHFDPNYPLVTDYGVARTAEILGEGLGRDTDKINTFAQMDLWKSIRDRVQDRVDGPKDKTGKRNFREGMGLVGPQRAEELERQIGEAMRQAEKLLDDNGAPIHFDFNEVRIPLKWQETYDIIAQQGEESAFIMRMLFNNKSTAIPPTFLMEAIVLLRSGKVSEAAERLVSVEKRNTKDLSADPGEPVFNFLNDPDAWGAYGYQGPKAKPGKAPEGARFREKAPGKGWYREYSSEWAGQQIMQALVKAMPALDAKAVENALRYGIRAEAETFALTEKTMEQLLELAADPKRLGEALRAYAKPGKVVKDNAKAAHARPDATAGAAAGVRAELGEAQATAQAATEVSENLGRGDLAGAARAQKREWAEAQRRNAALDEDVAALGTNGGVKTATEALEAPAEAIEDLSAKTSRDIHSGIRRVMDPLGRVFVASWDMNTKLGLYALHHRAGVLHKTLLARKVNGLRQLEKVYGKEVLSSALRSLQHNVRPSVQAPAEAFEELSKYMGELFDLSHEDAILGNVFFRNGAGIDYINDIFGQYDVLNKGKGAPKEIFFDKAKAAELAKANGDDNLLKAAADQWREWDVEDPIDFISKLNAAAIAMATDVGVAQSFVRMATEAGLASMVYKPGLVKLVASGHSRYHRLLPEGLYVDKELAQSFHRMDEVSRVSKSLDGELGKFVHNYFDPVQNAWKYAITLPRPGHHIRNFIGDESMTWIAEGTKGWKKSATDAFKVMSIRNNYEGVDIVRALNKLDVHELPKSGDVLSSGKYGDITAEGFLNAAMKEGLLPPAYIVEDLYMEETGRLKTFMNTIALRGGRIEKAASGVSEYRDHYSRLKHFIQFVNKAQKSGSYKTQEELFAAASKQVLKFHPDVTLLSTSEAKFARRMIPFYSWFRGAIPAMAESAVMNPARFNMFNKASYNLAVSMGINPDTLSDPFPDDQLFPSFLTEQMEGPQFELPDGSYFRVSPGFASWDVSNLLGPNPVRGVAGSTTPLVRLPAELLSGGSWGTGARINDSSDYLDSSIPGVNYLANLTGVSPTGSLASVLGGGGLDPQLQHARGNKDASDQVLSFVNFLSGLGIQNYSKPNYINYAEIEKRNREGGQRGF